VFADTVSARNFKGTNECHGWIGMRFQGEVGAPPSDVLLHVNLRDPTNLLQQQAIGILGVNLIHACMYRAGSIDACLGGLLESSSLQRIEIDHAEVSGPVFEAWPERELDPWLLAHGLCRLVAADANAKFQPPAELLYKQPILVLRALFDVSDTERGEGMLRRAAERLRALTPDARAPLSLFEVTLTDESGASSIERSRDQLAALGMPALLSSYREGHLLTEHLRRYTTQPIGFVLETAGLVQILWAAATSKEGSVLERLGRFLAQNVCGFVFPSSPGDFNRQLDRLGIGSEFCARGESRMVTVADLGLRGPGRHLVHYLLENGALVPVETGVTTDGK
jgi:hypothetical protein